MITEDDQLIDPELSEEDDWVDGEETTQLYEHFRFQVDRGQSPMRVDKYITEKLPGFSRNRVQMAADAVQPQFGGILLIIEVSGDTVVVDSFRIQVGVTLQAGLVVHGAGGMFKVPHGFPVDLVLGSRDLLPHMLGTRPGLYHIVPEESVFLWREVALCAGSHHSALAQEMLGFLPVGVGLLMVMAAHAILC